MSTPFSPTLAKAYREAASAIRVRDELAEDLAVAIETRTQAQKALVAAAQADNKAAFTAAIFASERAEAVKKGVEDRYRQARMACVPALERFFVEFCCWRGISPTGDDVAAAMRETLTLVKGGRSS